MKIPKIVICALGFLLFSTFIANGGEPGGPKETTERVVAYLIERIENSQLTFTRNGSEHSSQEAAAHIRKKYEHFKSRITSPEDFIHTCAAKSLASGEPYLVSTPQGKIPVEKWLVEMLKEYEKKQKPS